MLDAAQRGDLATVRTGVQENPQSASAADQDNVTPLHWACANGEYEMACLLLDQGVGVDVNKETIAEKHV